MRATAILAFSGLAMAQAPAESWPLLRASGDNTARSALIRDLPRRGIDRLPTEAEWEYAARAGTRTARFFGTAADLLGDYAWFSRNPPRSKDAPVDPDDPQRTSPVGVLNPNDFGLFDAYGNVWEWTQDRVERRREGRCRASLRLAATTWDSGSREPYANSI